MAVVGSASSLPGSESGAKCWLSPPLLKGVEEEADPVCVPFDCGECSPIDSGGGRCLNTKGIGVDAVALVVCREARQVDLPEVNVNVPNEHSRFQSSESPSR